MKVKFHTLGTIDRRIYCVKRHDGYDGERNDETEGRRGRTPENVQGVKGGDRVDVIAWPKRKKRLEWRIPDRVSDMTCQKEGMPVPVLK